MNRRKRLSAMGIDSNKSDDETEGFIIHETHGVGRYFQNKRYIVGGSLALVFLLIYNSSSHKKNGRMCFSDYACESNLCCPKSIFGTIGSCRDCCGNPDCAAKILEQPPPGEWGAPFCVDHQCVAYQNGKSSQVPADGYPVFVPSETVDESKGFQKIVMPRTVYSDVPKPIMEQVWYIDFNDQDETISEDIKYNGTHIEIPSFSMLHAGYSRSYNHFNEHETGIVTFITADNPYSVVSDYPKVGFVEKYHTLTYDGIKDTTRGDYMKSKSDAGIETEFNRRKWLARALAQTMAFLKSNINSQLEAGMDRALTWQIRRYVNTYPKKETGSLNPSSASWASHSEKAKQAIAHAKNPDFERDYSKSEQHCKHFERLDGLDYSQTSITFPLGRPITTITGELVNSPVYYNGVGVGYSTAHYDEKENILQIYFQTYSQSRQYSDTKFPGPYPSGLWVSPVADGIEYAIDPKVDGRGDGFLILEPFQGMGPLSSKIPADFTLWSRSRSEVCDTDVEGASFWEDIDVAKAEIGVNSIFDLVSQSRYILKGVLRGMPCANIWMRSDYGRGTNAFGPNEIGVWVHTLSEVRDDRTEEIGLAKWWDSWECFYRKKDPSLCSQD